MILYTPEELDHESYAAFSAALDDCHNNHPGEEIVLRITGNGGEVYYAMALYDQLQSYGNVVGVACGRVYSAHVRLWLACWKRIITPNAVIGLHPVTNPYELRNPVDQRLASAETSRLTQWLADKLSELSGRQASEWLAEINKADEEFYRLLAEDCLNYRIAHQIGWK